MHKGMLVIKCSFSFILALRSVCAAFLSGRCSFSHWQIGIMSSYDFLVSIIIDYMYICFLCTSLIYFFELLFFDKLEQLSEW